MKNNAYCLFFLLLLWTASLSAQSGPPKPAAAKKPWVALSGQVSVGTGYYYTTGGDTPRRRLFSYLLTGAPVLKIRGMQFPFSFSVSEQGRSYTQPLQQVGVSPKWKWGTAHAGFRSLTFSPYTLGGQQLLGGAVELNPGKFRLGLALGRLRTNALLAPNLAAPRRPMDDFSRRAIATKVGYGNAHRYLDLSVLHTRDAATGGKPAAAQTSNTVVGLSGQYRFAKRLSLKTELAASRYLDGQTRVLDSTEVLGRSGPSPAAALRWAGEASLNAPFKRFDLKMGFKQVAPQFRSMGCPYLQNDYRQYTFGGNVRAFKNKWVASGTVGLQTNDLERQQSATTRRLITTANVAFTPGPKMAYALSYNNFGLTTLTRQQGLRPDSVLVAQVNNSLSGSLRYSFGKDPQQPRQVALNVNFNQLGSFNPHLSSPMNTTNWNASLSCNLPWLSDFNPNLSLQWMRNQTAVGALTNAGLSLSLAKDWCKGKWSNTLNAACFRNGDGINPAGSTLQADLTILYKIRKRLSLSAQVTGLRNHSSSALAGGNFGELLGRLTVTGRF